jgi:hypothetical protein
MVSTFVLKLRDGYTSLPQSKKDLLAAQVPSRRSSGSARLCASSTCTITNGPVSIFLLTWAQLVCESTADGFLPENALAGAIPTEIGQLAQLVHLDLHFNQLTGASKNSLDCNFGIRVNLRLTKRSINYFTGRIPTQLGRCSAMRTLYLQSNKLTGTHILCS